MSVVIWVQNSKSILYIEFEDGYTQPPKLHPNDAYEIPSAQLMYTSEPTIEVNIQLFNSGQMGSQHICDCW